ncbi:MAG: helix-turn-helix domain-containing protein [Pedobacter sp.]|nr:MAG: helix-turn-helix domain-containing protein [Pedobacter sp.]
MTNHFQAVQPCDLLKDYVECYYFLKSDDSNFNSRHYSFPHTYNALSIYKDGDFNSKPSDFNVQQSDDPNYQMFIQVKRQAPLMVNLIGKVNRATILFKDFGINHFISEPLIRVMGYDTEDFVSWKEDEHYPNFVNQLFEADAIIEKGKIIDDFLLKRFAPIQLNYLKDAIALLCDFDRNHSIHEIALHFNTSLRSFNRNFKSILGVSPVEYRRIAQFRQSIENKLFQSKFKKLTDIGYESHFYDQSYFNKIYKKLAGSNPKKFFKSIDTIGNDKLIFQFINK